VVLVKLRPYTEIVGTLSEIQQKSNHVELIFTIQKNIEIPRGVISEAVLEASVGSRIGIFCSDVGDYVIRKIKG